MAEYLPPGLCADLRHWHFIRVSGEAVPEVWEDLRELVLPTYLLATENAGTFSVRYAQALRGNFALSPQVGRRTPPILGYLARLLGEWQGRWNLTPDWCERYALATLYHWTLRPDHTKPTPVSLGHGFIDPRPMLETPSTPKEFRDANAHRQREGWEMFKPPNELHLRWLALYQCRRESARAIGWEYPTGPNEESIYKAVQRTAALLGLPIRPRLS